MAKGEARDGRYESEVTYVRKGEGRGEPVESW